LQASFEFFWLDLVEDEVASTAFFANAMPNRLDTPRSNAHRDAAGRTVALGLVPERPLSAQRADGSRAVDH
jgi:hypothetical protein